MSGFRPAAERDVDRLRELERAAFGDAAWSRDDVAGLVRESTEPGRRTGALVLVDEEVHAYAALRWILDEAELLRVAVLPQDRRRGLARGVLGAAFRRLREHGATSCHLEVRADNAAAIDLYRDLGFEPAGVRRGYYRDGCDGALFRICW